jgi:hypothetical protein
LNQPALGNGANDEVLKGEGGEVYRNTNTTFGDIGTDDFVIELIGKWHDSGSAGYVVNKGISSGVRWHIRFDGGNGTAFFQVSDGVTTKTISFPSAVGEGEFFHAIYFFDRSGSAVCYLNSAQGTAVDISTIGSLTVNTEELSLLSNSNLASKSESGIVQASMWQKSSWLSTHLNADIAAERFYKWSGLYPKRATGTAIPTAYTRAGSAYAMKWNGTSYDMLNCGSGVPRVDYVKDDSGVEFKGMLIEPAATNLNALSNDINNVGWTKTNITSINTSTGVSTPDSAIDYEGIIADATSGSHYVQRSFTAATDTYCLSAILKKGANKWARIQSISNARGCYFDLDLGVTSNPSGALTDYGIKDLGNGSHLCWIVDALTAGTNYMRVYTEFNDSGAAWSGDATSDYLYAGFAQCELGTKPTSRIVTAGATVTRPADSLQYNGDNVTAGQGAFVADVLIDAHTSGDLTFLYNLSDGGATTERVVGQIEANTAYPRFRAIDSGSTQWTILGATDIRDGDIKRVRHTWETNNAKQYIDGALDGTPDTSATVPTGIDEIDIGQTVTDTNQLNGRIRNVQIWAWPEENLG